MEFAKQGALRSRRSTWALGSGPRGKRFGMSTQSTPASRPTMCAGARGWVQPYKKPRITRQGRLPGTTPRGAPRHQRYTPAKHTLQYIRHVPWRNENLEARAWDPSHGVWWGWRRKAKSLLLRNLVSYVSVGAPGLPPPSRLLQGQQPIRMGT